MKLTKLRALCVAALLAVILTPVLAFGQAVQVPNAEACFQATTGINGLIGTLGAVMVGSGGTPGTYTNIALTGGSGTGATANITVSGYGYVSQVVIYNPGINYVVGDTLSAVASQIGNVTGFSVPVASISINSSLAGGTVGMYQLGTLTYAQTWKNANQTTLNTNPIQLDQNGCAIIYGVGTYRQIVYDSLGNVVWDQPTSVAPVNPFWAGTATGTANAITVSDPSFASVSGQSIEFIAAHTNTGPTTLNGVPIDKNSSSGPIALSGGEIVTANLYTVTYDAGISSFIIQNPASSTSSSAGNFVNVFSYLSTAQINDVIAGTCSLDTSTAINTALTAMVKGKLLFPAGVFCVSSPVIMNTAQILVGSGVYATTLQALPGTATVLVQTSNFNSLVGTNTAGGPCSFGIRDMGLNGNKASVTGTVQPNIELYGYDFTFENVSTYNSTSSGVWTQWATATGVPVVAGCDGMESHIHHFKSFSNAGPGWTNEGPHDTVLDDVLIFINGADGFDCLATTSYECGITGGTNFHTYHNQTGELFVQGVATVGAFFMGSNLTLESDVAGPGLATGAYGTVTITNIWTFGNAGSGINLVPSSGSDIVGCRTSSNGSGNNYGSGNNITACN